MTAIPHAPTCAPNDTFWLAYYYDWSAFRVFADELSCLRHAVAHDMAAKEVRYGADPAAVNSTDSELLDCEIVEECHQCSRLTERNAELLAANAQLAAARDVAAERIKELEKRPTGTNLDRWISPLAVRRIEQLVDQRDRLLNCKQNALQFHGPSSIDQACRECSSEDVRIEWPCATARALEGMEMTPDRRELVPLIPKEEGAT